ncbi:ATP-dependent RNA helicase (mitochondrial) [Galdieria sulphuraria]|uniref:RNA helicase n=1 Tax=Galdieria sulphuraria TaxID=130081 RepID=M2W6I6_GALSU|nr:ATP-dependent RNA helicase (mitochondrial) [Galdieria sulphuraria]EME31361.1 ATP-dependent RNA helicase (mitochondrial) [Galdieria sulphuraria]|eukprot:XP_005707881.1 ATP-dependent RNA helicase (mitochondrial) [Galdieria sulphuraria]
MFKSSLLTFPALKTVVGAQDQYTVVFSSAWRRLLGKSTVLYYFSTDESRELDSCSAKQAYGENKSGIDKLNFAVTNEESNKLSSKYLKQILKLVKREDITKEYFQSRGIPTSLLEVRNACKDEQLQRNLASVVNKYATDCSSTKNDDRIPKKTTILSEGEGDKVTMACLPIIAKYLEDKYPKQVHAHHRILKVVDFSHPEDWYPLAREIKRRIILHIGPTNSGKTHAALEALRAAQSGIYCGPLRLLAWEIHERLNKGDESHQCVPCDLLTGQEQTDIPDAQHISCTIEMAPVHRRFQVGVIDEIQLLGDNERAWAWTRALLGLAVEELHLCGDPSSENIVRKLINRTQDSLSVQYYERLSSLTVEEDRLTSLQQLQAGDCLVAFSKADLFKWKVDIERETGLKCSVIYGGLPPEVRRQQSMLFNHSNRSDRILVATDAIGMGLNLNIRRVIFSSLLKFDGKEVCSLSPSQVRQIGGRAGRFGSLFPDGLITAVNQEDLEYIRETFSKKLAPVPQAGLFPSADKVQLFAEEKAASRSSFSMIWDEMANLARVDGTFFLCSFDDVKARAQVIEDLPLSIETKYTLCMCPVDMGIPKQSVAFAEFSRELAFEGCVRLTKAMRQVYPAENWKDMNDLESTYKILDMYLWLAQRFRDAFVDIENATMLRTKCCRVLQNCLNSRNLTKSFDLKKSQLSKRKKKWK